MNQVMNIFSGLIKHVVVCPALCHCLFGVQYQEKILQILSVINFKGFLVSKKKTDGDLSTSIHTRTQTVID